MLQAEFHYGIAKDLWEINLDYVICPKLFSSKLVAVKIYITRNSNILPQAFICTPHPFIRDKETLTITEQKCFPESCDCLNGFPFLLWLSNIFQFLHMNLFLIFVCSSTLMFNGAMNIMVHKYVRNFSCWPLWLIHNG